MKCPKCESENLTILEPWKQKRVIKWLVEGEIAHTKEYEEKNLLICNDCKETFWSD